MGKSIAALCNYVHDESKQSNGLAHGEQREYGREKTWAAKDNSLFRYPFPKLGFSTGFQGIHGFTPGGFQRTLESTTEAYIKKRYLGRISSSNSANFQNLLVCFWAKSAYMQFIAAGIRQRPKMLFIMCTLLSNLICLQN